MDDHNSAASAAPFHAAHLVQLLQQRGRQRYHRGLQRGRTCRVGRRGSRLAREHARHAQQLVQVRLHVEAVQLGRLVEDLQMRVQQFVVELDGLGLLARAAIDMQGHIHMAALHAAP